MGAGNATLSRDTEGLLLLEVLMTGMAAETAADSCRSTPSKSAFRRRQAVPQPERCALAHTVWTPMSDSKNSETIELITRSGQDDMKAQEQEDTKKQDAESAAQNLLGAVPFPFRSTVRFLKISYH
jgi:hypothetical protein